MFVTFLVVSGIDHASNGLRRQQALLGGQNSQRVWEFITNLWSRPRGILVFFFILFFSKLWLETDIIQILELNEAKLLSPQSLVWVTNPDSQTSWFRMYEIRPDNWYFWQVSRWCGFCWSHSGNCSPKGSSNLERLEIRLQTPGVSQFSHSFEASLSLSHCCLGLGSWVSAHILSFSPRVLKTAENSGMPNHLNFWTWCKTRALVQKLWSPCDLRNIVV